ncbi:MAG: hypothetical protein E7292_04385 [Lachnospiraceae bacterium]|nr:hypothetical protein [Lachnospiraceae bacterium]
MATFSEDYFEAKIVDNFYVRPMIRRSWAAQIEVLEEIDKVCKRHNIKYFAEWGTLLGAVRHQGFVPWDDDLDIGMLRDDYVRFLHYAKEEFPENLSIINVYNYGGFTELLTRVVNSWSVNITPEFMEKYHGCPYAIGVDIFISDYIPRDKDDEMVQSQLLIATDGLAKNWVEEKYTDEEKQETLNALLEVTGFTLKPDMPIPQQLYQWADEISGMYGADESDEITILALMATQPWYRLPKSCYESFIEMPFENITIPVPVGYEQILKLRYGENYMTPIKRWDTHKYPYFTEQEDLLKSLFEEQGLEVPAIYDMMYKEPMERYMGLQYHGNLDNQNVNSLGFEKMELRMEDLAAYQESGATWTPEGIVIKAQMLLDVGVLQVCNVAKALHARYIVIDTREFLDAEALDEALTAEIEYFRWAEISVYLENGYVTTYDGEIIRSPYSDPTWLYETVEAYNMLCGRLCFGICFNVGHANVLNVNLRSFVEGIMSRLRLVHMNDNDGIHDDHQMPYTFTVGRGTLATDIYRVIGALIRADYQGGIVFDVNGLWEKAPVNMQKSLLELLKSLGPEWEYYFGLKERLGQRDKKIMLFGTGAMAYNYMCNWAEEYPPYCMIDNNKDNWGKEFFGVPILSPDSILEIPEEERNVFICNMYYAQIATQLKGMGVAYEYYNDNYFM